MYIMWHSFETPSWIKITFMSFGFAAILFGGGYFLQGSAEIVHEINEKDNGPVSDEKDDRSKTSIA